MGDRYVLSMDCPNCSFHDDEIYYAPSCEITTWVCHNCHHEFDIIETFELKEINRIGTESGINCTIEDEDGTVGGEK